MPPQTRSQKATDNSPDESRPEAASKPEADNSFQSGPSDASNTSQSKDAMDLPVDKALKVGTHLMVMSMLADFSGRLHRASGAIDYTRG
jgi:hypothetical protein